MMGMRRQDRGRPARVGRRQRGLTMIEVLAAMVIFSLGAVVLFGWISATADRLVRVNSEQKQLFANLLALEFVRSLNPMERPAGEQTLGNARLRWQATPVGAEAPARTPAGADGLYAVQLFRTALRVESESGSTSEQVVYLAGWRQTRPAATGGLFDPQNPPPPPTPASPAPVAGRP